MPVTSCVFGAALAQFRTLPTIPQCIGVNYLRATLDKTRVTSHTNFLQQCLKRRVLPTGFQLKFNPSTNKNAIERILRSTSFRLMTQTVHAYNRRVACINHTISRMKYQLRNLLDRNTSHLIITTTRAANQKLYSTMTTTKNNKLQILLSCAKPTTPYSAPEPNPHLVVTIPTDLELSEDQRLLLSRGLKFVPLQPTTNQASTLFLCKRYFRRLRLAAHFEKASLSVPPLMDDGDIARLFHRQPSSWTPKPGVVPALDYYIDSCTKQITQLQRRPLRHSNLSPGEQKALQELKDRTDIVIKPADKGGAVVVWRRDLYLQEAKSQLSNTTFYSPIPKRTTKPDNALMRKTIKTAIDNCHLPAQALYAVKQEPRESLFYLLPKIHKANNPGRPIVSACSCPTVLISDLLDLIFQPLVSLLPTYVKDTTHALNLLRNFSFPSDGTERHVFTMDIVSLYTNIPHNDGLQAVNHFLKMSSFNLHIPTIMRLTELVLTLNSFAFDGGHFKQQSGVAMGTKMGPSFACLFVGYTENQAFSQYTGEKPALYKRFIDDCLGVATCSKDSLLRFIDFMSSFHPALRYTHCISDSSVSFLDINVTIQHGSCNIATSVFYKETDSHSYLLYSSSHPQRCRDSIPFSQFLRLRRICSDDLDFECQTERMVGFFLARQYPKHLVQKALERARAIPRSQALTTTDRTADNEDRTVAVLTFHPHNLPVRNILLSNFHLLQLDPHLKEIFPKPPLIAFKRDTNLRDHLVRASLRKVKPLPLGTHPCGRQACKTCPYIDSTTTIAGPSGRFVVRANFDCQSEDLVYVITCTLCSKKYTGETYRRLDERFTEHLRSMRLNYDDPVGSHFNSPHHSFTHARVAVVWQNRSSGLYRLFIESTVIARLGTLAPAGLNTRE